MTATEPAYITAPMAAQAAGVSRAYITRLAQQGRIPGAVRAGRLWLIPAGWTYQRRRPTKA